MTLLTKTSAASQIVAAMNSGDQNEMVQAWEVFGEEVAENIRRDFEQFRETKDDSVLAQRGYRVLTSAEQAWYTKVSAALKSSKTKQAFIDILKSDDKDDLMPETIIDDVLRYLVETRPLLSKIRFQNAGFSTKWIINDNSVQRGGWGEIDAKIIKEIKGSLKVIDILQAKYSAFCVVPLDILDMGPQFLDAFVRATMAEALGLGLEEAIVKGTGISMPVGMMKNPNGAFAQETGYPDKTAVKVTSFAPAEYGALVAKVAKTEKGKQRTFDKVAMLCNMTDYLTKIMPATTVLSMYIFAASENSILTSFASEKSQTPCSGNAARESGIFPARTVVSTASNQLYSNGRRWSMEQHCPEHSAHDRAIREHDSQLGSHGEQLDKLNETLAALKEIERQNQERIDGMSERLAALENVPAARWQKATDYVLVAVLGLVLGMMASHIGLS